MPDGCTTRPPLCCTLRRPAAFVCDFRRAGSHRAVRKGDGFGRLHDSGGLPGRLWRGHFGRSPQVRVQTIFLRMTSPPPPRIAEPRSGIYLSTPASAKNDPPLTLSLRCCIGIYVSSKERCFPPIGRQAIGNSTLFYRATSSCQTAHIHAVDTYFSPNLFRTLLALAGCGDHYCAPD